MYCFHKRIIKKTERKLKKGRSPMDIVLLLFPFPFITKKNPQKKTQKRVFLIQKQKFLYRHKIRCILLYSGATTNYNFCFLFLYVCILLVVCNQCISKFTVTDGNCRFLKSVTILKDNQPHLLLINSPFVFAFKYKIESIRTQ